jgi:ABC-2 type transport system permease protein
VRAVRSAIRSELTKIVTLRGVRVFTAVIVGLHVLILLQPTRLFADAVAGITPDGTIEVFAGQPQPANQAILGLLVASSLQISLLLPILAAMIAGHEFRARQISTTVLAVPQRKRLMAAKVVAAGVYLLGVAVVIAAISSAFMYLAVEDWNPGLLASGEALLGQAKYVAFAVLFSLTGFAVTIIARSTIAAIFVTLALITATMTQLLARSAPAVDALLPLSAGRSLLLDPDINQLTSSPTHGLVVLLAWAVASTVAAGATLVVRDAR